VKVENESVDVGELIATIKRGIAMAGLDAEGDDKNLRIVTVGLKLEAVAESAQGGGLRFRLPILGLEGKANARFASRAVHAIELTLEPVEADDPEYVRAIGPDVATAIEEAVATVWTTVQQARAGDDPWLLRSGTLRFEFVVTSEGAIALGVDSSRLHQHANTLTIEIEPVD
jgi:hypothetical protein